MSVNEDVVSDGLRQITETLKAAGIEIAEGLLGGDYGYGGEFESSTFDMHPYWWGDCGCGFDGLEMAWEDSHEHTDDCYQSELRRRRAGKRGVEFTSDIARTLAKEWGLPEFGCAAHCTCSREPARLEWLKTHDHDPKCEVVRPNFRHHATGIEIRWYKYIGRGMELPSAISAESWASIMTECLVAIREAGSRQR